MHEATSQPPRARGAGFGGVFLFLVSLGVAAGFYAGLKTLAPEGSLLVRYLSGHPVSYAETWMCLWGLLIVGGKAWGLGRQRAAFRRQLLPAWDGQPVGVEQAPILLSYLDRLPAGLRHSHLAQRFREALGFVAGRGSTDGLDDYLANQAAAGAEASETSFNLLRFITWAIPILGFLGTVFGINDALANVTPEKLAVSIAGVTEGLAVAFDTTAIALLYSMVLMFATFLAERGEQSLMVDLEAATEAALLHRFARSQQTADPGTERLLKAVEGLVRTQAELWGRALDEVRRRQEAAERQQTDRLTTSLGQALELTLTAHQQRLQALEERSRKEQAKTGGHLDTILAALHHVAAGMEQQAQKIGEQTGALVELQESGRHLAELQEGLARNFEALAQVGTFQQAVHSLTAAIHLLTARAESGYGSALPLPGARAPRGQAA